METDPVCCEDPGRGNRVVPTQIHDFLSKRWAMLLSGGSMRRPVRCRWMTSTEALRGR